MTMKIDIEKYSSPTKYVRCGKECVMDSVKHILRLATPEEIVRQGIVEYLHKELLMPYSAIETEIPLSYFVKGAKGRMDIVVYGLVDDLRFPVMVVECKAPGILLTDDVYEQAKRYSETVDIPVLMVTNGHDCEYLKWNYDKNAYDVLAEQPTYSKLLNPDQIDVAAIQEYHYQRYKYADLFKKETIRKEINLGDFVGAGCSDRYVPYVLNIAECLLDATHTIKSLPLKSYTFIEDGGIRFTSFGNVSGGSYSGLYRYILVKDNAGDVQIVSIGVFGCLNGRSLLIMAVDDFEKHHNSLQLSIEHFSTVKNKRMDLFHDGTMTVGKRGSVKKQVVIDYMRTHSHLNITCDGLLHLGTIDQSELLYCDREDMKELIGNLVEYALLRDELRKSLVKEK